MDLEQMPLVDLSPFTGRDSSLTSRTQRANDLASKLEINGWVGLTGHGVPLSRIQQAFDVSKTFFDLSYDEKMTAPHPEGIVPHRGYSGVGKEQGAASIGFEGKESFKDHQASQVKDLKESFEVGSEANKVQYNIWPSEDIAPGFRDFTTHFFWELNELSVAIVRALALGLGLTAKETQELIRIHDGQENQLRLLHYPAADLKALHKSNTSRLGAHSDWVTFTLLFQDETGGLEFLDKPSGEFVAAVPNDEVVYLNVGDMLHRYSNGRFPSAMHRVVPSRASQSGVVPARYSIPYFVTPSADEVVEPPSSVVASAASKLFEPITYSEYTKLRWEAVRV